MGVNKIIGIILIAAGTSGLVFTNFSYTKEEHKAKLGPIELSVKEKETVNIPTWISIGAIVLGGVLLLVGKKG